jgi:Fe-S cluster assembly protein SufD
MTQTAEATDRYVRDFDALREHRAEEPLWLRDLRREGFDCFQRMGWPIGEKRDEMWKYTDVRPVARTEFRSPDAFGTTLSDRDIAALVPFDEGMSRLVFIDGHYAPHSSAVLGADKSSVLRLAEAVREEESLVHGHLGRYSEPGRDASVGLNTAFFGDGVFIHADKPLSAPVHVVYITSDHADPVVTYPRTLVVAGKHSEVTLIETYLSLGPRNHFTDPVSEIALGEGSKVTHYRIMRENNESYTVGHVRPCLGPDSTYKSVVYQAGSRLMRLDLEVLIEGEGAFADMKGLYVAGGNQHLDNLVSIDHAKPHGRSRLYYKGILDGKSRAVFGGTVYVRPGADKTDAYQEDKNLLLSAEAEADSKPSLEIYADDVKCGHGATAGAVAEEAIFYLRSRGLDEQTAMRLLIQGFASEVLDGIQIESLRTHLEQLTMIALAGVSATDPSPQEASA